MEDVNFEVITPSLECVKQLYNKGKNADEIGELVGRSGWTIRKWLNEANVFVSRRTNIKNVNFFQDINTEEKAYWLGFIYADGCILKGKILDIGLSKKDSEHLQKLSDIFDVALYFYSPISSQTGKTYESVRLVIRSKKVYNDLVDHGIEERKTYSKTTQILTYISTDLLHHFIRGYFDGDGYVGYQDNNKKHCKFNLLGTHDFMSKVQKIMENNISNLSKIAIVENSDILCSLNYGKHNNFKQIYKWLYIDAVVWLERKRNKFEEILVEL